MVSVSTEVSKIRYASSSIAMRLVWVTQAAFASRDLMGPPGRVVEVRTGTAQRCGDPPSKIMEVSAVSLSC